jgi:hypothetical protein
LGWIQHDEGDTPFIKQGIDADRCGDAAKITIRLQTPLPLDAIPLTARKRAAAAAAAAAAAKQATTSSFAGNTNAIRSGTPTTLSNGSGNIKVKSIL